MSVSLIELRLEIEKNYPLLPHIHFSAIRQKRLMASNEAKKGKIVQNAKDSNVPTKEVEKTLSIDKCRGSRVLQEMTIETLHNMDSTADVKDNISGSAKLEKPDALNTDSSHKSSLPSKSQKAEHISPIIVPKSNAVDKKSQSNNSKKTSKVSTPLTESVDVGQKPDMIDTPSKVQEPETNTKAEADKTETKDGSKNSTSKPDVNSDIDKRNRLLNPPIQFSSGNHFVEVTKGLLHLYKENQRTTLAEEAERSQMLCILAVPAAMTTHDLLQFVAPVYDGVEHMRIIKENKPNQYMVLLKFKNQMTADIFYKNFNGTRFNSIEPEVCHLAFVSRVETIKESEEVCLPLPGLTELPTCPVCLERMDESVEGILTILCNHSFHGSCLAKWGDTSCPVCRYSQTPELMPDNRCVGCGSQESLWICLICGHIGCGRYVDGHAYHHYLDTQHTYAMQLETNRVWDYAGDNYVHRLVQNKADGKPVELEPQWMENEEKMDSMQLEYTYLLTSQLEAQRHYFEDRLTRIETESLKQLEEMKEKTKHAVDERKQLEEKLNKVIKDKQSQEKKITQVSKNLSRLTIELKEEKEMNKCLRQNQSVWQQKLNIADKTIKDVRDSKEKEISDLQEQVRDLMFYFDAKDKLMDVPNVSAEEIQEGQIVIGEASGSTATESSNNKPRKKKHR